MIAAFNIRKEALSLKEQIEYASSLEEIYDKLPKAYVPDSLMTSYRRKSQKRSIVKSKRIIDVRSIITGKNTSLLPRDIDINGFDTEAAAVKDS